MQRDVVGKCRKWGFSTERVGLGLHRTLFTTGHTFRIVAHRQATAEELNKTVKLLYETAVASFREIGEDPHYYLVKPTGDRIAGYEFGTIHSAIHVDTSGGKGVGQSDRNDDVYATEYSDWERADDVFAGLFGSQPPGSTRTRFTIDFNAHGKGSDAYLKYTRAKLPHTDPAWNGFTPFFAGILDVPEWYTPEDMELKRRSLKNFVEVYPSNDQEMWLANEKAVFNAQHILEASQRTGGKYAGDGCPYYLWGVDTASGREGGDFQAAVCFGWKDGMWWEACPPIWGHWPEEVFAEFVNEAVVQMQGMCVVERNVGALVLKTLREMGTPGMYRHRHRDKTGKQRMEIGFPTTEGTKRIMRGEMERALRDGEIGLVTPKLVQELEELEYLLTDDGRETVQQFGAPEREGCHDDLAISAMLALQGAAQLTGAAPMEYNED